MRYFVDERNPGERIPETQIMREYGKKVADGEIDPFEVTYPQYQRNYMSSAGGTLSEVLPEKEQMGSYSFMIRETHTLRVMVKATSFEKAQEEVERGYETGEFNLEHNCFAGAEFRPCCYQCKSDFDNGDGLREINCGTPLAMLLCDRCIESMEEKGEFTRCGSYQNLFSSSRMIANPEIHIVAILYQHGNNDYSIWYPVIPADDPLLIALYDKYATSGSSVRGDASGIALEITGILDTAAPDENADCDDQCVGCERACADRINDACEQE